MDGGWTGMVLEDGSKEAEEGQTETVEDEMEAVGYWAETAVDQTPETVED